MARLQGISGGMSGKTGSFTYRQSRGETIVSQYQPVVKNPNTEGQQTQRARFKLMTQLAAIMAPGFGTMGITKRPAKLKPTQRNAFVSLNMPLVDVNLSADKTTALIAMEKVKLTSSNRMLGEMSQSGNSVSINVADSAITAVRFVRVDYVNGDITRPVIGQIVTEAVQDDEVLLENIPSGKHTVLAYGLIPTSSASQATLDNLHTPSNNDYFATVNLTNLVNSGEIVETETLGVNISITA